MSPAAACAEDGTYMLSEEQARAILELRLQRLTGLERDKIADELKDHRQDLRPVLATLADRGKLLGILGDELREISERFANPRRTHIEDNEFESDIEDLIQREEMVVTVSMTGYVKRVPLSTYRAQKRGGKGRTGMTTKDEDVVSDLFVASTHAPVLFFTTRGIVHRMKVYRLPIGVAPHRAARRSSTCCRSKRGRNYLGHPAAARRRDDLGPVSSDVRHLGRHGAAQPVVGLRQYPLERPDRDEAGG